MTFRIADTFTAALDPLTAAEKAAAKQAAFDLPVDPSARASRSAEALHGTAAALASGARPPFDRIVIDEAQELSLAEGTSSPVHHRGDAQLECI